MLNVDLDSPNDVPKKDANKTNETYQAELTGLGRKIS